MTPLPNASENSLADVIRRVGHTGFETSLSAFLSRAMAPDNVIILAYRDAGPPEVLFRHSRSAAVFQNLETTYLTGAYLLDPYHDLHIGRVPAGAYRLADVAPDAFHRSRYFLEYYRQTTLLDEVTFVGYPVAGVTLNLCLGRDENSLRAFTVAELETCQRLAPILVALIELHWAGLDAQRATPSDVIPALIAALAAQGIALTQRQAEVALLILRGHSSPSIGLRLGVSAQTVKVFRKQLYARCGISSQAELFSLLLPLLR